MLKPLTNTQFENKVKSALKADEITGPQHKTILAAYGVYSSEMSRANAEVSSLKVDVEKGNTALADERTRTVAAGLLNQDNLKVFAQFWVKPISQWGTPALPHDPPEKLVDPADAVVAVQGQAEEFTDAEILEEEQTKNEKQRTVVRPLLAKDSLDEIPWLLRIPTLILAKVFGELTPLAAAILIVTVITGSISYGVYASTTWKGNFDREKETTSQLQKQLDVKNEDLKKLAGLQQDLRDLSGEYNGLERAFEAEKERNDELTAEIDTLRNTHAQELAEKDRAFAEQILTFETDAQSGFRQREQEHLTRIGALENEVKNLSKRAEDAETSLAREVETRESKSATEQNLRDEIATLRDEVQNLFDEKTNLESALTETKILITRIQNAIRAVDSIFWAKSGYLETRRACYREHYISNLQDKRELAESYGIPLDMPSATYNLKRDSRRRLEDCGDFT